MSTLYKESPLYRVAEIRALEQHLFLRKASYTVMRQAGRRLFEIIMTDYPQLSVAQTIHIVLGCGNNAGDGLILAGLLKSRGLSVVTYQVFPQGFVGDAAKAAEFMREQQVPMIPFTLFTCRSGDLVVDAIFGIGLTRPAEGLAKEAINHINFCRTAYEDVSVYAVDLPSGLLADTGRQLGDSVIADKTVTFIADKIGLHTGDGKHCAGEVVVENLDVQDSGLVVNPSVFHYHYPANDKFARLANQHKGDFGHTLVIGGGQGMFGAAALSSVSALKAGAGKVSLLTHADYCTQYHVKNTPLYEVMRCDTLPTVEVLMNFSALVLGPGLGRDAWGKHSFEQVVETVLAAQQDKGFCLPVLIDADGLWHLSSIDVTIPWLVITPHDAEAAKLLQTTVTAVCDDKITAVRQLAQRYQCIAVLKGAGTLVSDGESVWVNSSGNVNLATAGSGDVLAGIIGGHLTQLNRQINSSEDLLDVVRYGVYQHGLAADDYQSEHKTKSLRASDLWDYL